MRHRWLPALGLVIAAVCSCSLIVDKRGDQCLTDGDCSQFSNARCDGVQRLCVVNRVDAPEQTPADAGSFDDAAVDAAEAGVATDPCRGDGGCYQCRPSNDVHYANACTTSHCRPFDNGARLRNLLPEGGLPPLPN